jgi:hypothetical protein
VYRIVFTYAAEQSIQCVFAERRSLVYELLWSRLRVSDPVRYYYDMLHLLQIPS